MPLLLLITLAADQAPEPEDVKAGWTAFLIFILLIAAVVFLGFQPGQAAPEGAGGRGRRALRPRRQAEEAADLPGGRHRRPGDVRTTSRPRTTRRPPSNGEPHPRP